MRAIELGKRIAGKLSKSIGFTPKIIVDHEVVTETVPQAIAQLALIEQDYKMRFSYEHEFLGSKKLILLSATFKAKAGFDVSKRFEVRVQTEPFHAEVIAPEPLLISLEMGNDYRVEEQQGYWNRIAVEDRQTAFRLMQEKAREDVLKSGILEAAQKELERRVMESVTQSVVSFQFSYGEKVRAVPTNAPATSHP